MTGLPRTGKDIFQLSPGDWLRFNALIGFYRLTGLWRYPIRASGDFETMTRRDLAYWLYKAQFPITRATRNSGLEAFFRGQASLALALPCGFTTAQSLELSAAGDLMDHPYLARSAGSLYRDVAETVFGADLSMANLECVVYPERRDAFALSLSSAPALYYDLERFAAAAAFDGHRYSFLSTANNHSLDCGEAAVDATIRTLRAQGIAFHGMNESEAASFAGAVVERKGFRLGVISHTFGLNAKKPPVGKAWIVNRTNLNDPVERVDFSRIERQIRDCRDRGVDAVIAQLHWGMEHEYYPRPEQLAVAHHLAELGVDIVIGHHPHVTQPMEYYRTARDPDRVVPIYYSLGNLITPFTDPRFRASGVARIKLARGRARDGITRTYVEAADMTQVYLEIDQRTERIHLVPRETDALGRVGCVVPRTTGH